MSFAAMGPCIKRGCHDVCLFISTGMTQADQVSARDHPLYWAAWAARNVWHQKATTRVFEQI